MTTADALRDLARGLRRWRLASPSERVLQEGLAAALALNKRQALREHRLGEGSIVDFYLPDSGIALEVKVDGSLSQVTRQLHRYAEFPEVRGLLLVSTRSVHQLVGAEMAGKPVLVHVLRQGLA